MASNAVIGVRGPTRTSSLASLRVLAPARGKEQAERCRVDEGDQAEVDGEVANSPIKALSALR